MKKVPPTPSDVMRRHLIIMVKEPRPGRVKTRLGADIGMTNAAWWFRHQSARLLRQMGGDSRWKTYLAVSPDLEGLASRIWPRDIPRIPQGSGDLGQRMSRLLITPPPGPCLLIGADIPAIRKNHIVEGFAALKEADAVLGPAQDGGFWMIGLRRGAMPMPPKLFQGVRWSSEHALNDTIQSMSPIKPRLTSTLRDVDTAADL